MARNLVKGTSIDEVLNGDTQATALTVDDLISAGAGNDILNGLTGSDILKGEAGSDQLFGGEGDDILETLDGDTLVGGTGNDTYNVYNVLPLTITELSGEGTDTIFTNFSGLVLPSFIENLTLAAPGANQGLVAGPLVGTGNSLDNVIIGNRQDNTLSGDSGADKIYGSYGDDWLQGGSGNDELYGNQDDDRLDGGTGGDLLDGGDGNDTYVIDALGDTITGETSTSGTADSIESSIGIGSLATFIENLTLTGNSNLQGQGNTLDNQITGNSGNNSLKGLDGNDTIFGGNGKDNITGDSGNDTLHGEEGDDSLNGGSNDDLLYGGNGNDSLNGGFGNDMLVGGDGNDKLIGSYGQDTYRFSGKNLTSLGLDTITNYELGGDSHMISLDASIFVGTFSFESVANDTLAASSGQLIAFSQASGSLFYGGTQFAQVFSDSAGTVVTTSLGAGDFVIS